LIDSAFAVTPTLFAIVAFSFFCGLRLFRQSEDLLANFARRLSDAYCFFVR